MVLAAVRGAAFHGGGPHPQALGAGPVRGAHHEAAALAQQLVQDVGLALGAPTDSESAWAGHGLLCMLRSKGNGRRALQRSGAAPACECVNGDA